MKRAARFLTVMMLMLVPVLCVGGCGALDRDGFPNQIIGADGRPLVLDEIEAIVSDDALSKQEKREELRDLGLADEKLIEALLTL